MSTVKLNVQGMSCGACVSHVEATLKPLSGVENVTVDLEASRVLVSGAPDIQHLVEALRDAGYPSQLTDQLPSTKNSAPAGGSGCCCR